MLRLRVLACAVSLLGVCAGMGLSKFQPPALEKQTLKNFKPPVNVKSDAPAKEFSLEKAGYALDSASLHWWQARGKCFTCHTNVPYLYSRALINADDPAPKEIRQTLEDTVDNALKGKGKDRLSDIYAVSAATALAINDSITTKKLHPLTKAALDHMWSQQSKDGSMPWGGGVAPVGSQHFGAAITCVGVGVAPEGYAQTPAAQKGIERVKEWFAKNPARVVYDKAMVLWASCYAEGILTDEQKKATIEEIRGLQLADGGWSLPAMGNAGKGNLEGAKSDGYATGLAVYAMRQAGVPANDPAIAKGITWLKSSQLESGRWPTQSLNKGVSGVLTNTGSAFAVMALHACSEQQAQAAPAKIQLRISPNN